MVIKVDPYDVYQVQLTLDDMLPTVLNTKFTQSFRQMDIKLLINTFLNILGLFAIGYGFKYGFHPTKIVVGVCSAVYLVISGIWNFYSMFMCRYSTYSGQNKQGTINIYSKLSLPSPTYFLTMTWKGKNFHFAQSYEKWFMEDGVFLENVFRKDVDDFVSSKIN